jgi:transposase-like protein
MSDEEAHETFKRVRFALNGGDPYCPACGCAKVYVLAETPVRWKCSACQKKFSVTSGTIFHSRKLAIRDYLHVIALFVNGVKGVSSLNMARDMNINPKSAFVMLHKLREAMGAEVGSVEKLGSPDNPVEVDGTFIGGDVREPNKKADREKSWWKRRQGETQAKQVSIAIARERYGRAIPWVVGSEREAVETRRARVSTDAIIHADEGYHWNSLRRTHAMMRVRHRIEKRADNGANINQAESYFARIKRSEFGIYHRLVGTRLQAYADEMAWRENHRRQPNGTQWTEITTVALAQPKSATWAGYWHRRKAA